MTVETRTTCPYCGVGCGVIARRQEDGTVSVRGDPDHPANFGRLCSKGSALAETLDLDERLLAPEIGGRQASWDEALDLVATRFAETIDEHGPDSVAFYLSGQLLTEDYYVANKLMKGFVGSANIDTNSRLCMSSSVAGHRRAFGADTVPGVYEDLERADLVVLVGSNLVWCHPVLAQRLAAARAARPQMTVVVIDPRRTQTADMADLHLAIRPDGDVALFMGLLAYLAETDTLDRSYIDRHTRGFAEALSAAQALSPEALCRQTGLSTAELQRFYRLFASREKTVTCYSQGVNQSASGTDKVNAIVNCHLATGRIGRVGMGPFSLTGQPNAMGGREVGGLANMLAAHMQIEKAEDRARVQRFWASPRIAERPGLKAVDLFRAVEDGRVKALWIMATNPVISMPEADRVKAALAACPFTVLSDVSAATDTAPLAHVRLPSLAWGEKDGSVTNSERRISRQRAFLAAPGEARADWWQLAEVARRMGHGAAFSFSQPAEIFAEHARLSAFENGGSRDFDLGGLTQLSPEAYAAMAPVQWPVFAAAREPAAARRFFAEGGFFHEDGRARFVVPAEVEEAALSPEYPLVLNSGRIRDQWHSMTRTGKSARLAAHLAEPFVEIHPADAQARGIAEADLVILETGSGRAVLRALVTERQARGNLFVPIHWTGRFSATGRIGALIHSLTDPHSGQPASKCVPVAAQRFSATAYGFAVSAERPVGLDADYWALARAQGGWRLELAFAGCLPTEDWEAWCRRHFAIPAHVDAIGYRDGAAGTLRLGFFDGERLLAAFFLAPQPVEAARTFLAAQLMLKHAAPAERLALLSGRPGGMKRDPGATVCACFNVGANQIREAAEAGCRSLGDIGAALSAGTNCGSCRGEIAAILARALPAAAE